MNTITITATELLPGDISGGDKIETVNAGERFTYITFEGDDTRMRTPNTQLYTVERDGGISTATRETVEASTERPDLLAAEANAAAARERELINALRRERRQFN